MARFAPANAEGFYSPTTPRFDEQTIQNLDVSSPEFKEFLRQLGRTLNNIQLTLNQKPVGRYSLTEQVSGKEFFPVVGTATNVGQSSQINRQSYFKTINFGALPNTATTSVAHNINFDTNYSVFNIYGAATDPAALTYISVPFSSPTLNENIKLDVDATNINITTGIDYSAYTVCCVVLEYLKN